MTPQVASQREVGIFRRDAGFHIAQPLRARAELGRDRKNAAHRIADAFLFNGLGQYHEAAAFGINGQPVRHQFRQTPDGG